MIGGRGIGCLRHTFNKTQTFYKNKHVNLSAALFFWVVLNLYYIKCCTLHLAPILVYNAPMSPATKKASKSAKPEKVETKRLVLLDTHAILHRAYHALPDFSTARGEPTGALYGLSTMLISIIEQLKPDYVVACYDLKGPTFRHEAYKGYKAQRKETDDDLITQINRSPDIFTALDIPMYSKEGYEADDMLGTIVEQVVNGAVTPSSVVIPAKAGIQKGRLGKQKSSAQPKNSVTQDSNTSTESSALDPVLRRGDTRSRYDNLEIVIASGDMDTLQLVKGKEVQVYTLKKGIKDTIIYDEDMVRERFGFGPELIPDYKGLRGDPSDNIIGVKGIGEKTATILITTFGTLENMYKELEAGPPAGGEKNSWMQELRRELFNS